MRLKSLVIILIIVALLTATSTMIYYSFFKVVQVQETTYSFSIENNKIGLNGDKDAVRFGTVSPGGTGTRFIYFENEFEFPVKVKINVKGDKYEWIMVEENNFVLETNTNKTLKITIFVPNTASEAENYTGKVFAYYSKA